MAFSRTHLYAEDEKKASYFFRALSHSARLKILFALYKHGPATVKELRKSHPISQPSISQHLSILRKDHLIICHEKFPYTIYRIHKQNFLIALKYMKKYLNRF